MIQRATYDLLRVALRLAIQLWPLWLFWFVWSLFDTWWLDYLLSFPERSTPAFVFAYRGWPSVALLGPILLMSAAIVAYRLNIASRLMPFAGVAAAKVLTAWPEYQRLEPYVGSAPLLNVLRALDDRPAPGAWPVRQFRPCRLARHPRRTPAVSRSGCDPWRHRRWRGLPRRSGPRGTPRLRSGGPQHLGPGRHRAAADRSVPQRIHPCPGLRRARRVHVSNGGICT
jgi:hypothetical protein